MIPDIRTKAIRLPAVLILTVVLLIIQGCSVHRYIYTPEDMRAMLSSRFEDDALAQIEIPFETSREMVAFAEDAAGDEINSIDKSINIVQAIISRWELDVEYERIADFTAEEVFHHTRKANCLSFTHLFVSLARAVHVQAHYVDVRFESQMTEKNIIISNHHICAGVYDGAEFFLIDFDPNPEKNYRVYRVIDDLEALAHHYNNLAINEYAIFQETYDDALIMLDTALTIKPDFYRAMNNKGAVFSLMNRNGDAERAFRDALAIEPSMPEANANLASLLMKQGKGTEAIVYAHRAVSMRPSNADYRYRLALVYLHGGYYAAAYKQFRWITRHNPEMLLAFQGLATTAFHLGHLDEARDALNRMPDTGPDTDEIRNLRLLINGNSEQDRP
ncbi:tetratricopeptide repeat protein [bacterium]|nr:tetratricopeptide repeat protein [candidate division CSSED10-310 bacterium]